ncbi:hypothetical protein ACLKA6_006259 [Drosophila palustris]
MAKSTPKSEESAMLDIVTTNSEDQKIVAGVEENTLREIELEVVHNMELLNENEETSQLSTTDDNSKKQGDHELMDASHQDNEDPIKIKPRKLMIKEMKDLMPKANEVEGPTTRSRSATPASLFRSRVKELIENPQNKESTKITRATKAITSPELLMDAPKQKQRSTKMKMEVNITAEQSSLTAADPESEKATKHIKESNKSVNNEKPTRKDVMKEKSWIEHKKSAEAETEVSPDALVVTPTKSAVPSTPSTSSSCHSTRKLRVLMKKPAAQSFHKTISLDQQEHADETEVNAAEIKEDTEPTEKPDEKPIEALTESTEDEDIDVEFVQTEIPRPTESETDSKPKDLAMESVDKDQHQEEPVVDQINNSSDAETTGVTTSFDKDNEGERVADDSLLDG